MIAKVNELIGSSEKSFEDAASEVLRRAHRTLRGVTGIEVIDKRVIVEDERIVRYQVRLRLVFQLAPGTLWHV
jgi:flavin-binding protein dodecin